MNALLDLLAHPLIFLAVLVTAGSVGVRLVLMADAARDEAREYLEDAYVRAQRAQRARVTERGQARADRACGNTETGIVYVHDLPKRAHRDDVA